jgi:hypothetical protein
VPSDGRFTFANYGKGVAFWETDAQAANFVNNFENVVSDDVYFFTDNDTCDSSQGGTLLGLNRDLTPAECHRASNYGAVVKRVRSLETVKGSKPVWGFVEDGHPSTGNSSPTIQPAQIRAAVWSEIINGARGIIYFNHSFGGSCQTQHVLRDPCYASARAEVTSVDAQITSLAPVLNSPSVTSGYTTTGSVNTLVKWSGGHFYVFEGSTAAVGSTTGVLKMSCVGNATATVVGENRTVPVVGGVLKDTFANANAVHIYRINGGTTCGL